MSSLISFPSLSSLASYLLGLGVTNLKTGMFGALVGSFVAATAIYGGDKYRDSNLGNNALRKLTARVTDAVKDPNLKDAAYRKNRDATLMKQKLYVSDISKRNVKENYDLLMRDNQLLRDNIAKIELKPSQIVDFVADYVKPIVQRIEDAVFLNYNKNRRDAKDIETIISEFDEDDKEFFSGMEIVSGLIDKLLDDSFNRGNNMSISPILDNLAILLKNDFTVSKSDSERLISFLKNSRIIDEQSYNASIKLISDVDKRNKNFCSQENLRSRDYKVNNMPKKNNLINIPFFENNPFTLDPVIQEELLNEYALCMKDADTEYKNILLALIYPAYIDANAAIDPEFAREIGLKTSFAQDGSTIYSGVKLDPQRIKQQQQQQKNKQQQLQQQQLQQQKSFAQQNLNNNPSPSPQVNQKINRPQSSLQQSKQQQKLDQDRGKQVSNRVAGSPSPPEPTVDLTKRQLFRDRTKDLNKGVLTGNISRENQFPRSEEAQSWADTPWVPPASTKPPTFGSVNARRNSNVSSPTRSTASDDNFEFMQDLNNDYEDTSTFEPYKPRFPTKNARDDTKRDFRRFEKV